MNGLIRVCLLLVSSPVWAATVGDDQAELGKQALLYKNHIIGMWNYLGYENAWKYWKVKSKPRNYDAAFRERYGLHPAPYENDGLPMGLRRGVRAGKAALSIDCMLCHGGSILGKSYVGLPNTTLDLKRLFFEVPLAGSDVPFPWPFSLNENRGTTNADAVGVFLLGFRNPDLSNRIPPLNLGWRRIPDLDTPAWWLWKKKKTIYANGGMDARSTRSTMQFLLGGIPSGEKLKQLEPVWEQIKQYLWTLEAPKYPFEIDEELAARGEQLFANNCSRCHGTYGDPETYPNKVIAIDIIGTDRARYDTLSAKFAEYYNESWFGEKFPAEPTDGYQAPPLDGIWATAPYFHNGSVPTVYQVLNSERRPTMFRIPIKTDETVFDKQKLGRKVESVDVFPSDEPTAVRRLVYDTSKYGKSNRGHTFGDKFSESERMAVIEYLKKL